MVVSIEQHVDWIADCIALPARARHAIGSRPTAEAEDAWVDARRRARRRHALPEANSWYVGREHPRQAARLHAVRRRRAGGTGGGATRWRRGATPDSCSARRAQSTQGGGMSDLSDPTTSQTSRGLSRQGIETVVVGGRDTHGVMRGKRVPIGQLARLLGSRHGAVRRLLGHAHRRVRPRPAARGPPRLLPDRAQRLPGHPRAARPEHRCGSCRGTTDTALILCDWRLHDGEPVPIAPRSVLQRVVERAREMGFEPTARWSSSSTSCARPRARCMSRRAADLVPLDERAEHVRRRRGVASRGVRAPRPPGHARSTGCRSRRATRRPGPGSSRSTCATRRR